MWGISIGKFLFEVFLKNYNYNLGHGELLEFKKVEKSGTCTAVWLKNRVS